MKTQQYSAKISSQGQITLPKEARDQLQVATGNFISIRVVSKGTLEVTSELPIEQAFGSLGNSITCGEDAAVYTRTLRQQMEQGRFTQDD